MHGTTATDIPDNLGAIGLIPAIANAAADFFFRVDAFERFKKTVNKMDARLLAIADAADAGMILRGHRNARGVTLGLKQRGSGQSPDGPQFFGLGQPAWFGQAAGNGRAILHRAHHSTPIAKPVFTSATFRA